MRRLPVSLLILAFLAAVAPLGGCEPRYDTIEWVELPVECGTVWRVCYERDDDPDWQKCYLTDAETWQIDCEWPCEDEADATCGPQPPG